MALCVASCGNKESAAKESASTTTAAPKSSNKKVGRVPEQWLYPFIPE